METQIAKLGAELVILGTEEMMHLPVEIELNDKKSLAKKIPSSWTWVWKKHLIEFENFLKCLIWNSTPKNIFILLFGAKMAKMMIFGKARIKLKSKNVAKETFLSISKHYAQSDFFPLTSDEILHKLQRYTDDCRLGSKCREFRIYIPKVDRIEEAQKRFHILGIGV